MENYEGGDVAFGGDFAAQNAEAFIERLVPRRARRGFFEFGFCASAFSFPGRSG